MMIIALRCVCFHQVGLLDVDLCGPSVPTMLQIEDKSVLQGENGFVQFDCRTPELHFILVKRLTSSTSCPVYASEAV